MNPRPSYRCHVVGKRGLRYFILPSILVCLIMEIPRLLFHISLGYFPAPMVLQSDRALIIGNEASVLSFPLYHTITYEVDYSLYSSTINPKELV